MAKSIVPSVSVVEFLLPKCICAAYLLEKRHRYIRDTVSILASNGYQQLVLQIMGECDTRADEDEDEDTDEDACTDAGTDEDACTDTGTDEDIDSDINMDCS